MTSFGSLGRFRKSWASVAPLATTECHDRRGTSAHSGWRRVGDAYGDLRRCGRRPLVAVNRPSAAWTCSCSRARSASAVTASRTSKSGWCAAPTSRTAARLDLPIGLQIAGERVAQRARRHVRASGASREHPQSVTRSGRSGPAASPQLARAATEPEQRDDQAGRDRTPKAQPPQPCHRSARRRDQHSIARYDAQPAEAGEGGEHPDGGQRQPDHDPEDPVAGVHRTRPRGVRRASSIAVVRPARRDGRVRRGRPVARHRGGRPARPLGPAGASWPGRPRTVACDPLTPPTEPAAVAVRRCTDRRVTHHGVAVRPRPGPPRAAPLPARPAPSRATWRGPPGVTVPGLAASGWRADQDPVRRPRPYLRQQHQQADHADHDRRDQHRPVGHRGLTQRLVPAVRAGPTTAGARPGRSPARRPRRPRSGSAPTGRRRSG